MHSYGFRKESVKRLALLVIFGLSKWLPFLATLFVGGKDEMKIK